jgi:hypothetical protein
LAADSRHFLPAIAPRVAISILDVAEEVQPKKCLDGMTNVERAVDVT